VGYLWTIASRLAWRLLRRPVDLPLAVAARVCNECGRLEARAAWIDLERAVAVLPERQRVLIGLSASEIPREDFAAITGDTPKTVDRQLGRARRRLRAATSACTTSATASR
jgi:DNA-directed RNA polymerase specialized sigma24 family protein